MPTNHQRREAAKRKLQRQLVRREQMRSRRRRTSIIGGTAAVLLVAAGVTWLVVANTGNNSPDTASVTGLSDATGTEPATPSTPCNYTPSQYQAIKPAAAPTNLSPANTGTLDATIKLGAADLKVTLDRALAPCSVNSFLSLASQGYYNDTNCSRLTNSEQLHVLQCGDASDSGTGEPGYSYEPTVDAAAKYPVGTLAMGNAQGQAGSLEGAQFFIVYGNTEIPSSFSIIGKVAPESMATVDAIAAKGVVGGQQDGKPVEATKVVSVTVPAEAVTASTVWATSSAPDSGALPTEAVPNEPVPSEAVPSEPVPSESVPAESAPSAAAPSESAAGTSADVSTTAASG